MTGLGTVGAGSPYEEHDAPSRKLLEADSTSARRAVPVQVSLYERAAEERDARAMVALGTLYFLGRDVARDLEKAAHWRARAFLFWLFAFFGLRGKPKNLINMIAKNIT